MLITFNAQGLSSRGMILERYGKMSENLSHTSPLKLLSSDTIQRQFIFKNEVLTHEFRYKWMRYGPIIRSDLEGS